MAILGTSSFNWKKAERKEIQLSICVILFISYHIVTSLYTRYWGSDRKTDLPKANKGRRQDIQTLCLPSPVTYFQLRQKELSGYMVFIYSFELFFGGLEFWCSVLFLPGDMSVPLSLTYLLKLSESNLITAYLKGPGDGAVIQ